jgi:membrane fusion protein (multidrug efflux system)
VLFRSPERYAARASVGEPVRVRVEAYPDRTFGGSVSKVSPVVDPATRSTVIEARLDNAGGRLRSGMFGEVTLITGSRAGVLAVPRDALTDGSGPAVFVIENGKACKRDVELGLQGDQFIEIRKGLKPGEKVAVFGLYGLKDGSPVDVLAELKGDETESR